MTLILIFKLVVTPILILAVTLAARHGGPMVGGLLMGIPLVTGPISFIVALENGKDFAAIAGLGNLVGQVSVCLFCFAYARAASRYNAIVCVLIATLVFFIATSLWNQISWSLLPAAAALLSAIADLSYRFPQVTGASRITQPPVWDVPLRMVVATGFVILLSTVSKYLGPQLSGLVAPFPTFVLILAVFTHSQNGAAAAIKLLRGVVTGSLSFAAFFICVSLAITRFEIATTYALAILAAILTSGCVYLYLRRRPAAKLA